MPARKRRPLKNKTPRQRRLLLRKKLRKGKSEKLKFTKTAIAKLVPPPRGIRDIYRDTYTLHLCLRVTPTAKTFYWEATVRGRQRRVTIGRFPDINVVQAKAQAADITADYTKGIDVQETRAAFKSEGTFGELWEDYKDRRRRKVEGKESQALNYQWERYLKKLEKKQLSEINHRLAYQLIKRIRKRAQFHANRIQRQGKAMFNFAKRDREWRWAGENPFDFDFVRENAPRKIRLWAHEMPQFIKGLDACSESMRLLFLASLYTGRRMGEVKAMRWTDLDLTAGIWTIPETKPGGPQEAVLPTELVSMLVERKLTSESPWVFPSPSKSGHVEEIMKAWSEVRETSGLQHLQARDLRRTLASWAQDVNVPIAAVQAQLGHASISTTAKHYTAISRDVKRAALESTVASMIRAAAK